MNKARTRRRVILWARHNSRTEKLNALCLSWGWVRAIACDRRRGTYFYVRRQTRTHRG